MRSPAERVADVSLRVRVHEQYARAGRGEACGKMDSGGRFADTALHVDDRYMAHWNRDAPHYTAYVSLSVWIDPKPCPLGTVPGPCPRVCPRACPRVCPRVCPRYAVRFSRARVATARASVVGSIGLARCI